MSVSLLYVTSPAFTSGSSGATDSGLRDPAAVAAWGGVTTFAVGDALADGVGVMLAPVAAGSFAPGCDGEMPHADNKAAAAALPPQITIKRLSIARREINPPW